MMPTLLPTAFPASLSASKQEGSMIHVVAIVTAKPGQREAVLAEFRANMPAVHAEEGCLHYEPVIDAEGAGAAQTKFGPDTFCVIEKWTSLEALQAHSRAPHMQAYGAKVRDRLETRVIHILSPAAG
jgi:quinol monooxygenase YgiN